MDPDKLAERDRARRQKQLRQAKMQGLALIGGVSLLLAWALIHYFNNPPAPAKPKEKEPASPPAATTPPPSAAAPPSAAPSSRAETPASAAPPAAPAGANPTVPAQTVPGSPVPGTISGPTTTSDLIKELTKKPKSDVPMSDVLGSIGLADSARMKRDLPKVQEARRVVEMLGKAADLNAKLEYVINKPGIEQRLKDYYLTKAFSDPESGEQVADYEAKLAGDRYLIVLYKNPARPSGVLRASFIRDEHGAVRLDWESFVGYSAMSMKEFREKRPDTPVVMRVLATADDYHNYEFSDAKKYFSVRLRNAAGTEQINGFCEDGGRVATAVVARLAAAATELLQKGAGTPSNRSWAPIVVKVRFPKNAQSDHCVELMEMMNDQWLTPPGLVE